MKQPFVTGTYYRALKPIVAYGLKPGMVVRFTTSCVWNYSPDRAYLPYTTVLNPLVVQGMWWTKGTEWEKYFEPVPEEELEGIKAEQVERLREKPENNPNLRLLAGASMNLGSDPEVFVVNGQGTVVPAFQWLPAKPKEVGTVIGGAKSAIAYWDGFQAEWVQTPQSCIAYFSDKVQAGLKAVHKAMPKGAKINPYPVVQIPTKLMESVEPEHRALGCMPSLNAYGEERAIVEGAEFLPWRCAGFHVHVAHPNGYTLGAPHVRMLDRMVGTMMTLALQGLEDPLRRTLYGRAGEYRTPKHGIEWRVPSSAVLWHPAIVHLLMNMARLTIKLENCGLWGIWECEAEEARSIINGLDVDGARSVLNRNRRVLAALLAVEYGNLAKLLVPIEKGFKELIELDVEKNWKLAGPECDEHTADYAHSNSPEGWKRHADNGQAFYQRFVSNLK